MIMMDLMYGICVKSNSDSLNESVEKSNYDSRIFFCCGRRGEERIYAYCTIHVRYILSKPDTRIPQAFWFHCVKRDIYRIIL